MRRHLAGELVFRAASVNSDRHRRMNRLIVVVVSAFRRTVTVRLKPDTTCEAYYSERSATSGSTRVARRAGTYDASAATTPNITTTAANVVTSSGVSPNSRPSR